MSISLRVKRSGDCGVVASRKRWAELPCLGVGHVVPTTAVLTTPARNKAKALFRSRAPALLRSSGDAPKAGHLRPTLARETVSVVVGEEKNISCEAVSPQQQLAQLRRLVSLSIGFDKLVLARLVQPAVAWG